MTLRMQGVLEILPEVEESATVVTPVVPDSSAPALLRLVRVGTDHVSSSPVKLSPYWVKRRFVLTDNSLRYCTASAATPQLYQRREHGTSLGQIRADRRLKNAQILVPDITGVVPRAENKFDVHIRGGKKWRLRVPSNNHHVRRMWIDHIVGVAARSSPGVVTPAADNIYREDSSRFGNLDAAGGELDEESTARANGDLGTGSSLQEHLSSLSLTHRALGNNTGHGDELRRRDARRDAVRERNIHSPL